MSNFQTIQIIPLTGMTSIRFGDSADLLRKRFGEPVTLLLKQERLI